MKSKVLVSAMVLIVAVSFMPSAGAMTWDGENAVVDTTVALFHANEGSGTTLTDSTGNYNMTATGSAWIADPAWDVSSPRQSTYGIASGTDFASGANFTPDYTQDFTLDAWVRSDGYQSSTQAKFGWDQNWNNQVFIGISQGFVYFDFCDGGFLTDIGRDGEWHHAAMSYDAATGLVTYYVDNVVVSSNTPSSKNPVAAPLVFESSASGLYLDEGNFQVGVARTDFSTPVAPVPEPTTMGLLALGGLAVLRRRSRKA